MAHHGSDPLDPQSQEIREMFKNLIPERENPFGATGRFPQGKYIPQDEGEIQFGVAADKQQGKVLINFGKPVAWFGMDAQQADDLGDLLKAKAAEIRTAQF